MTGFSRPPQDELDKNLERGFVGLHFEQGVPVLDRDLNLLQDLLASTVRTIVARYIGAGISLESRTFLIEALPEGTNDFRICAGEVPHVCLVGGMEVDIGRDTRYDEQSGVMALTTPSTDRVDSVYLDVQLITVDGNSELDLLNPDDVQMQTTVRLKPEWRVRVAENADAPPPAAPGHTHFPLARLARRNADPSIRPVMLSDLRQRCVPLVDLHRLLVKPRFAPDNPVDPVIAEAVGNVVTLRGFNFFVGPVQVHFGGILVDATADESALVFVDPYTIEAKVPQGFTGSARITVTNDGGSAVSDEVFTLDASRNTIEDPPAGGR